MKGMQGEQECYRSTLPRCLGETSEEQEQHGAAPGMKDNVDGMVPGRVQTKQGDVQHVRDPG